VGVAARRRARRAGSAASSGEPAHHSSVDRVLERVVVDEQGHAPVLDLASQDLAIVDAVLEVRSARAVNAPTIRL
jgi:hypothetical protein